MGTQTMGSQAGVGDSSVPKLSGLSRQGSLYSLTFDEVQNQLGNLGKPLGSLNLDELLRTVEASTQTVDDGGQNLSRGVGGGGVGKQSSISLSRDLKEKTVEELWREIQQVGKSSSHGQGQGQGQGQDPERQNTLGEMTLEDFLVQAGIAIDAAAGVGGGGGGGEGGGNDSNLGGGGVDPNGGSLANVTQHGQWMPYQMLPHQQQHSMMPMFMPGHAVAQPLSGGGAISDTGYADRQMAVSTSAMMGTLSDTQAVGVGVGRKRIISGDVVEKTVERRQKRMIKNRESAARSRARKQAYTNELENKVSRLEEENVRLRRMMEVEKALPSVPPPPPKHQLRRTNSGPI